MQYITNAGISHARYTFKYCKHHHRYLRVIAYPISVIMIDNCNYILNHVMSDIAICPFFFLFSSFLSVLFVPSSFLSFLLHFSSFLSVLFCPFFFLVRPFFLFFFLLFCPFFFFHVLSSFFLSFLLFFVLSSSSLSFLLFCPFFFFLLLSSSFAANLALSFPLALVYAYLCSICCAVQ